MTREFLHAIPEAIRREAAESRGLNYDRIKARALGVPANPPLCWYCWRPATNHCTEKLCEPWITFPGDLERFALIQDSFDLAWVMVESVERKLSSTPGCPWLNDEIVVVKLRRRAGLAERFMRPLLPVLELRNEPCARPSCDLHARDLGDGEHFRCLQHWYEDAPRPAGEAKLAKEWAGLLETSLDLKREERKR